MARARLCLLLLAAVLLSAPSAVAADEVPRRSDTPLFALEDAEPLGPDEFRAAPAAFPAPVGERLRYAFSYWGVPLGTTTVEVKRFVRWEGRRVAHIVARAETHSAFHWLYRVDDRAEALVDLDTLRTYQSRSWMEHRDHRIYEEIEFDWDTHWVRVLRERRHSGRGKEIVFDFGPFAHDPLALLYTARAYPVGEGAAVTFPVYASAKIRGLRLTPARAEDSVEPIESRALGTVRALRLRPEPLLDGTLRNREGRGLLWVSAEGPRLPLRMAGWFRGSDTFRVGGLRGELVGYHPAAIGWENYRGRARPELVDPVARTVEGRPIWDPSESVREARSSRRAGPSPGIRRFRFAPTPEAGPFPRPAAPRHPFRASADPH